MGTVSRVFVGVFGIIAALLCAGGGVMLLMVETADTNSVLPLIAHGIGVYCLGRSSGALASIVMGPPDIQRVEVVQRVQSGYPQPPR